MPFEAAIVGAGMLSPVGASVEANLEQLYHAKTNFSVTRGLPIGCLHRDAEALVSEIRLSHDFRAHDRVTLLGVIAAREARRGAKACPNSDAVIMGSSRGATSSIETAIKRHETNRSVSALTSPVTTAGTLATAIARDGLSNGLALSLSAACATSLHAIGIAAALMASGQILGAIAGGAEAATSDFTVDMLRATKVYAKPNSTQYPSRPLHPGRSGLVLAEGSACLALGLKRQGAEIVVSGYGAATETGTMTGVSEAGTALVLAIERALATSGVTRQDIAFIAGHGAGTIKGDSAELMAYKSVFGTLSPPMVFHKWLTGHMLAASSAAAVIFSADHLVRGILPAHPYFLEHESPLAEPQVLGDKRHALVCALGFGGNAAALILSRTSG